MLRPDEHPDEGTIHAWLDGALTEAESAEVAAHVESCPSCAAAVADARGIIAAASRILSHLDDVAGDVVPVRPLRRPVPWYRRVPMQAAAALLLVAFGTTLVLREWPMRYRSPNAMTSASAPAKSSEAATMLRTDSAPSSAAPSTPHTMMQAAPVDSAAVPDARQTMGLRMPAAQSPLADRRAASQLAAPQPAVAPPTVPQAPAMDTASRVSGFMESASASNAAGAAQSAERDAATAKMAHVVTGPTVFSAKASAGAPARVRLRGTSAADAAARMCDTTIMTLRPGVRVTVVESDSGTIARCISPAPKGMNTLTWTDSTTHRVMVLRGAVPISELDSLVRTPR